jgi:hypothetical protein
MLREETDFISNAIGIDPSGCGCTDCIVGNSIPESDASGISELLQEHFTEGRAIVNRTYSRVLVAYKSANGEYTYESLSLPDPSAEVRVIEPEESSYDGEGIVICESDADGYEPMLRADDDPDNVKVISIHDDDAMASAIEKHFRYNKSVVNRIYETIIAHESYGDYGFITINHRQNTEVSIIR